MTTDAPVISAKNVWKIFGSDPEKYLKDMPDGHSFDKIRADGYIAGVKDVSIEVSRGEMLVIMGLSGSGKSTLVRCFSRLHEITGGTIEVEGQDIMSLTEKELIDLGVKEVRGEIASYLDDPGAYKSRHETDFPEVIAERASAARSASSAWRLLICSARRSSQLR